MKSRKSPRKTNPVSNNVIDKMKEKKLLLKEEHKFVPFIPQSLSPPSYKGPVSFNYNLSLKSANLPNTNTVIEKILYPAINKDNIRVVTPSPTEQSILTEKTQNILKVLDEINIKKLIKKEGDKKSEEYKLSELKSFISRLSLRQNIGRKSAVKQILELMKNYSRISLNEYNEYMERLENK